MFSRVYQERIMSLYRDDRYRGRLQDQSFEATMANPLCGDSITIQVKVTNGVVSAVAFEGKGCVISQAAASMLASMIVGKSVSEIRGIADDFFVNAMELTLGPNRMQCATLALKALHKGVSHYKE